MSFFTKIVQSLFNAILPRTTGFASVNPADFQPSTILLVCLLMWIGGSSQSMAGGVKVNTVAVLFLNLKGIITGSDQTGAFHRAISEKAVLRAYAVAFIATVCVFVFSFILILLEPGQPIRSIIFEVMSASIYCWIQSLWINTGTFRRVEVCSLYCNVFRACRTTFYPYRIIRPPRSKGLFFPKRTHHH